MELRYDNLSLPDEGQREIYTCISERETKEEKRAVDNGRSKGSTYTRTNTYIILSHTHIYVLTGTGRVACKSRYTRQREVAAPCVPGDTINGNV